MKTRILFVITLIFFTNAYSQIKFEKGYFITNAGQKKECLIKNTDSYLTPKEFKYKELNDTEIKTITVNNTREVVFLDGAKYIRETVLIDKSSNNISKLSQTKEPNFEEETLFLESLIEGEASLYVFSESNFYRYFYKLKNSNLKQLIYKKYKDLSNNSVKTNNRFRQQLWESLKCETITLEEIKKVNYAKQNLIKYFASLNTCKQSAFVNFATKNKSKNKGTFNLNIRPGILFSSLEIDEQATTSPDLPTIRENDFGSQTSFRIGVELEYVLPLNRNKWALILEPNYQRNFSATGRLSSVEQIAQFQTTPLFRDVDVELSSLEIPFGVRHYFFLNDSSKLFINGGLALFFPLDSEITIGPVNIETSQPPIAAELATGISVYFGIGYNFNNKYSIEARFVPERDFIDDSLVTSAFSAFTSSYSSIALTLGYTLF